MTTVEEIRKDIKRYRELDSKTYNELSHDDRYELAAYHDAMGEYYYEGICILLSALDKKEKELYASNKLLEFIGDVTYNRDGFTDAKWLGWLIDEIHEYSRHPETAPIKATKYTHITDFPMKGCDANSIRKREAEAKEKES